MINLKNKKINLSITKVDNSIVVNAKINSFDNFVEEMIDKGKDINYSFNNIIHIRIISVFAKKPASVRGPVFYKE